MSLKESVASLQQIVEALAGRIAADEIAHLSNDNARLRREVEGLRSKACRREFSSMRTELSAVRAGPSDTFAGDWLKEIWASTVASVDTLIDARFAGIEERLLPAKTLRPPLAADRQQTAAAQASVPVPATNEVPVSNAAVAKEGSALRKSKPKKKHAVTPASSSLCACADCTSPTYSSGWVERCGQPTRRDLGHGGQEGEMEGEEDSPFQCCRSGGGPGAEGFPCAI